MNQRKYVLEIISDVELAMTPMEPNQKLTTIEYDDHINSGKNVHLLIDPIVRQRLIGRLICLNMTRPYINYSVQVLNQFMHKSKQSHRKDAIKILRM